MKRIKEAERKKVAETSEKKRKKRKEDGMKKREMKRWKFRAEGTKEG